MVIVASKDVHKLHAVLEPTSLSDEYQGTYPFEVNAYIQRLLTADV